MSISLSWNLHFLRENTSPGTVFYQNIVNFDFDRVYLSIFLCYKKNSQVKKIHHSFISIPYKLEVMFLFKL